MFADLKVWEIAEVIGISVGSVVSIFNDHLGSRKLDARSLRSWPQTQLSDNFEGVLAFFNRNSDKFLRPFNF